MGQLKNYFDEYLSSEEFDLMFDDEYEMWLNKEKKYMSKTEKNIFLCENNVLPLQHIKKQTVDSDTEQIKL